MFVTNDKGTVWVDDVKFVHMLMQDFRNLSTELQKYDITASLGGDGLLKYLNELVLPTHASEVRAEEVLKRLQKEGQYMLQGVEVGVFAGDMSKWLLARNDIRLTMVDSWTTHEKEGQYANSDDFHANLTQDDQDHFQQLAKNAVAFAGDRACIVKASSLDAAKLCDDESLDFVFIDADHSYEGCKADIDAWYSKVKVGGLFGGHDYENTDFPKFGVTHAVNDFVHMKKLALDLGDNFTWFVRK